jgi:hypothetical protein
LDWLHGRGLILEKPVISLFLSIPIYAKVSSEGLHSLAAYLGYVVTRLKCKTPSNSTEHTLTETWQCDTTAIDHGETHWIYSPEFGPLS